MSILCGMDLVVVDWFESEGKMIDEPSAFKLVALERKFEDLQKKADLQLIDRVEALDSVFQGFFQDFKDEANVAWKTYEDKLLELEDKISNLHVDSSKNDRVLQDLRELQELLLNTPHLRPDHVRGILMQCIVSYMGDRFPISEEAVLNLQTALTEPPKSSLLASSSSLCAWFVSGLCLIVLVCIVLLQ